MKNWGAAASPQVSSGDLVAYFSAEFAVDPRLPIYSGGLGILAGDVLKQAADLGIPFLGCGLFYRGGYFRQQMDASGRQHASPEVFDLAAAPVERATAPDGTHLVANVVLAGRPVELGIWRAPVGDVPLYLLDSDRVGNAPEDRTLTHRLYGGDAETRLRQEFVIGIGGVRALRALDLQPAVWHANEGHAAFIALERLRECMEAGASFEEARAHVSATGVFTTHTPVAAGHDAFAPALVDQYFAHLWPDLGLDRAGFHALGRLPGKDRRFHVSALALRLFGRRNAVSERHERIARRMWHVLWPEDLVEEVPIGRVTNGVHFPTWTAPPFVALFARHLGEDWQDRADPDFWERADDIPDADVREAHAACKRRLFAFLRERALAGWREDHAAAQRIPAFGVLLDPETLTIGFARRFATYKRAGLLFRDPERLRRLLLDAERPIQIVFAGKAHPADEPGQRLLAEVYRAALDPAFGGRLAFIENYDLRVAKVLVAGVDAWLNTPRPPLEASGTSGQKAAINGVPQLSTPDGWWAEGWSGDNGWVIGPPWDPETPLDEEERDEADEEALFALLEGEVRAAYYDRDAAGMPHAWIRMMRAAIRVAGSRFSARRMLQDYVREYYRPAASVDAMAGE